MTRVLRLVFEALPRIIALTAFWKQTAYLLTVAQSELYAELLANPVGVAGAFASIPAMITGSPVLYAITLVLLALAGSAEAFSATAISGLILILVLDHVRKVYRTGQSRSIRYPRETILRACVSLALLGTGITVLCFSIGGYIQAFITVFTSLGARVLETNQVLALFLGNPLVHLVIVMIVVKVFYSLLGEFFDTATLYLYPSRSLSLKVLTSTKDVDVYVETPMRRFESLILASVFAPPLYAVFYDLVFPHLETWNPGLAFLGEISFRVLTAIVVMGFTWYIIGSLSHGFILGNVGKVFALSMVVLTMIYGAAVLAQYEVSRDIAYSLVNPDIDRVGAVAERIYINYYLTFFYLINILLKLVGVAP